MGFIAAVRSLEDGLEETLTLHRLGLFEELGKSLKTTNCIESLMSQIGQREDYPFYSNKQIIFNLVRNLPWGKEVKQAMPILRLYYCGTL